MNTDKKTLKTLWNSYLNVMHCCYPEDQPSLCPFSVAKRESHFSDTSPLARAAEFSALLYLPLNPAIPSIPAGPLSVPKKGYPPDHAAGSVCSCRQPVHPHVSYLKWITMCEFSMGWKWKSKPHSLSSHSRKKKKKTTHPDPYKLLCRDYFTFLELKLILPLTQCYWFWQLNFPVCLFHIY